MPQIQTRAHIVVPETLVAEIDAVVGKRGRSRFFAEAVEEKLERMRSVLAFRELIGALEGAEVPGWETRESTADWVHDLRRDADRSLPPPEE